MYIGSMKRTTITTKYQSIHWHTGELYPKLYIKLLFGFWKQPKSEDNSLIIDRDRICHLKGVEKNVCKMLYQKFLNFNHYFLFLPSLFFLWGKLLWICAQLALSSHALLTESSWRTINKQEAPLMVRVRTLFKGGGPGEGCTSPLDGMCCLWSGTPQATVCLRQLVLLPSSLHRPLWCLSRGLLKTAGQKEEVSNNLTWKVTTKPRCGACWAAKSGTVPPKNAPLMRPASESPASAAVHSIHSTGKTNSIQTLKNLYPRMCFWDSRD